MQQKDIRKLHQQGLTVRQIVDQTGFPRTQVQEEVNKLQQEQRDRTFKLLGSLGIFVAIVLVFAFAAGYYIDYRRAAIAEINNPSSWKPAVTRAIEGESKTFTPDNWLLVEDSNADAAVAREVKVTAEYAKRLDSALETNAGIPEVKRLKDEFGGKFYPTMFSTKFGGTSRKIFLGSSLAEASKPQPEGSLEVCFYPKDAQAHSRIRGGLLFYSNDWRALFIGALDYPDKRWFDALAIHELWHAHMHRLGALSSTAQVLSDLWITEELQAHNLENIVLDKGTGGNYLATVRAINQGTKADELGEYFKQITADSLVRLNGVFESCSEQEGSVRTAQYLYTLVNDWLSRKYQGEELLKRQIEAYRAISKNL